MVLPKRDSIDMSSLEKKKTKASIKDRFPLEKLTVSQLVKKLNVFYGT
jgi:hypothetical protein